MLIGTTQPTKPNRKNKFATPLQPVDMGIQWACLEEFYTLVSWNKGLERVRYGVVRQVRECIKKEYTFHGKKGQRKEKGQ